MPLDLSRYLDLYVAESREHLCAAREIAARLPDAGDAGVLELYRHAHSLKGMAAAMGYARVAEISHAAEDLLDAVRRGQVPAHRAAPELLEALACLACMVERVARGETPDDPAAERCARRLRRRAARAGPQERPPAALPHPLPPRPVLRTWRMDFVLQDAGADAGHVGALLGALGRLGSVSTAAPSTLPGPARLMVLLRSDASREDLTAGLAALPGVASFVVRLDADRAHLTGGARRPEGVARVPAAALEALVMSAQDLLLEESRPGLDAGRGAAKRRRLLARLHAQATELRLEPFDSVTHRVVAAGRQAGAALGRRVRIVIEGGDLRLERSLLDALVEPLLHVVRNAVDHGIESPDARARLGKPAEGTVRLRLESGGSETRITVEDDGHGLDPTALRAAAVRLGAASAEAAARLSDEETLALILRPGFTTAPRPGPVSGRGIGMDVVRTTVESLGGTLALAERPGGGTRVTFHLPRSLAARPGLLLRGPLGLVAVPLESVRRVETASTGETTVCLARGDGTEARLPVDEVLGRREIVVQPLPAPARAEGYGGAALLEDGEIALVLDPGALNTPTPTGGT